MAHELFAVPTAPENALEKLHQAILSDLDRAIEEAVDKAIEKKYMRIKS